MGKKESNAVSEKVSFTILATFQATVLWLQYFGYIHWPKLLLFFPLIVVAVVVAIILMCFSMAMVIMAIAAIITLFRKKR